MPVAKEQVPSACAEVHLGVLVLLVQHLTVFERDHGVAALLVEGMVHSRTKYPSPWLLAEHMDHQCRRKRRRGQKTEALRRIARAPRHLETLLHDSPGLGNVLQDQQSHADLLARISLVPILGEEVYDSFEVQLGVVVSSSHAAVVRYGAVLIHWRVVKADA